jgi:hypothetical protein
VIGMDIVGWSIGVVSLAYAVWTNHRANVERKRSNAQRQYLHSFLKGLKPSIDSPRVLAAINDEMERLIPPRK